MSPYDYWQGWKRDLGMVVLFHFFFPFPRDGPWGPSTLRSPSREMIGMGGVDRTWSRDRGEGKGNHVGSILRAGDDP